MMKDEQSVTGEEIHVELWDVQRSRYQEWVSDQISRYRCKD